MPQTPAERFELARAARDRAFDAIRTVDDLTSFIDRAVPVWDHEIDNILLLTSQAAERGMTLEAVTGAPQWAALGRTPSRAEEPFVVVNRRPGGPPAVEAAYDISQTRGPARHKQHGQGIPEEHRVSGLGDNVRLLLRDIGWKARTVRFVAPEVSGEANHARREVLLSASLSHEELTKEALRQTFSALLYSARDPHTDHREQADAEAAAGTRLILGAHGISSDPQDLDGWRAILIDERPRLREFLARVHSVSRTVLLASDPIRDGGRPVPSSFELDRGVHRFAAAEMEAIAEQNRPRRNGPAMG